jgi:2-iminobutanoate/2-iminopropanoate deaminase
VPARTGRSPSCRDFASNRSPIIWSAIATGLRSILPPFDPETGEIKPVPFERQAELILQQMKLCLETAGSSLTGVIKCNVYCTPDPTHFARFNAVYDRVFGAEQPPRIFMHVPSWPGPFDIEVDCVAVVGQA